jgi:hypothetical protein
MVEVGRQLEERKDPEQTGDEFQHGRGAAAWDLALAPRGRLLGWVDIGGHLKHGGVEPAAVLGKVKGRANQHAREKEDKAGIVEKTRQLGQAAVLLEVRQLRLRQESVGHIPTEGGELHDQDHLGARDIHGPRAVGGLARDVVHTHVAHQEDETDPRHEAGPAKELGDGVGTARRYEHGSEAIPKVEQAHEVEDGYAASVVSQLLLRRLFVRSGR